MIAIIVKNRWRILRRENAEPRKRNDDEVKIVKKKIYVDIRERLHLIDLYAYQNQRVVLIHQIMAQSSKSRTKSPTSEAKVRFAEKRWNSVP